MKRLYPIVEDMVAKNTLLSSSTSASASTSSERGGVRGSGGGVGVGGGGVAMSGPLQDVVSAGYILFYTTCTKYIYTIHCIHTLFLYTSPTINVCVLYICVCICVCVCVCCCCRCGRYSIGLWTTS